MEADDAVTDVRMLASLAGHLGDAEQAAALADHADPEVRAAAVGALARLGALGERRLTAALADSNSAVRRRAAEAAAGPARSVPCPALPSLVSDPDPFVAETACWALGERAAADALPILAGAATGHEDPLVREAAVAALGAIGDPGGLEAILAGCRDKPAIRRRAVLALAPFDGPEVEAAIDSALKDRDWQVRQAAEDLRSVD